MIHSHSVSDEMATPATSGSANYILSIESTCDETAAAVISRGGEVLSSCIASQELLHQQFDGVVPEIAARAHLERILPVLDHVLVEAAITPADLAAIAVATEPGLPGSLLVGLSAAKALCVAWQLPLVAVNHVHAHIYACQMERVESIFPCVGFVISGGHTNLYQCSSSSQWEYLGGTIDDAAGEAFDKVAVMLGLGYPGGPALSAAAKTGNAQAYDLPRPLAKDKSTLNLSFSGLKTAVRYNLVGMGKQDFAQLDLAPQTIADMSASFQAAVVDCLVAKSIQAIRKTGLNRLVVGGGVAANPLLRERLLDASKRHRFEVLIAPPSLCTDNAIMGAIAWEKVKSQRFDSLELDVNPGLVRGPG